MIEPFFGFTGTNCTGHANEKMRWMMLSEPDDGGEGHEERLAQYAIDSHTDSRDIPTIVSGSADSILIITRDNHA